MQLRLQVKTLFFTDYTDTIAMTTILARAKLFVRFSCIFIFLCLFSLFFASSARTEIMSVKGDNVHFRTGPGVNYPIKWVYSDGLPVQVLERKGDWVKVRDFEDDSGWLNKAFLTAQLHAVVKANRFNDESINIRSEPSSDSKIVGVAYYGVVFKVLELHSGWVKVQHKTGLTGWISSFLLWGF